MRSKQYDVLVVDDDAEDRMIMGEVFAGLDCADRVTMYESGIALLKDVEELKALTPLPLLIVLDYNLPGCTGAEVLQTLKRDMVLFSIPVVMYSTGMSPKLRQECLDIGALGCFEKGATYEDVVAFVKHLRAQVYALPITE